MASYLSDQIKRDKQRYEHSKTESIRRGKTVRFVPCSKCGQDVEAVAGMTAVKCSRCWFA